MDVQLTYLTGRHSDCQQPEALEQTTSVQGAKLDKKKESDNAFGANTRMKKGGG